MPRRLSPRAFDGNVSQTFIACFIPETEAARETRLILNIANWTLFFSDFVWYEYRLIV